jgi:hypothetical protein
MTILDELRARGASHDAISAALTPAGEFPIGLDSNAPDLLPRKARGDYREKTVTECLRDAVSDLKENPEEFLITARFDHHPSLDGPDAKRLGSAMRSTYVVETRGAARTRILIPIHAGVAAEWKFKGRYKMYNGVLLTFLARKQDGQPDTALLGQLLELFNGTEGMTLLDREMLKLADAPQPGPASAERLVQQRPVSTVVGAPATHELFRRDLATALQLQGLGRRDKVHSVLTVLYMHVALHYWRLAFSLDAQVREFAAWVRGEDGALDRLANACDGSVRGSCFRGQLLFRIAMSASRSISQNAQAAVSYASLDREKLLTLPANLTVLQRARWAANAVGCCAQELPSFAAIGQSCGSGGRQTLGEILRLLARHEISQLSGSALEDARVGVETAASGPEALQRALVLANRKQLPDLGRDITAQVMKRGGKGLVSTRGNVSYFEMGQDLLLLLTKLIARDERIRYGVFLEQLADYGLAPQDRREVDRLAEAMRAMQLLEKHSDSGEAMYVSHFL